MFVLRIQEHLIQMTQDLSGSNVAKVQIVWLELLMSCINDQEKLKFDFLDYIWVQNLEKE